MKNDPSIEQIRKARHQISAKFGHDPRRLVQYYIDLQKKHHSRIIESPSQYQHEEIDKLA